MRVVAGLAVAALAAASLSGIEDADPRTPPAAPGMPAPFLGTAVIGSGGLVAAVDAYGDVVDLRYPGPAGQAQISNSFERQRVGSVDPRTGITASVGAGGEVPRPLWSGSDYGQRYLPDTNALLTSARVGGARVSLLDVAGPDGVSFVRRIRLRAPGEAPKGPRGRSLHTPLRFRLGLDLDLGGDRSGDTLTAERGRLAQVDGRRSLACRTHPVPDSVHAVEGDDAGAELRWRGGDRLRVDLSCSLRGRAPSVGRAIAAAVASDRRWIARARPLGEAAPDWAGELYTRSLLVLRALADRRSGAIAAGARDRWAYVWPRDAATGALAFDAAGYREKAIRGTRFLLGLRRAGGARFRGDSSPVDGRGAAGDAGGWIAAAGRAVHLPVPPAGPWRSRHDYLENSGGDLLGNAIAGGAPGSEVLERFGSARGLVRRAGDPGSGLDSAAAWAVAPFERAGLSLAARGTLLSLAARAGRYGIRPAERFPGEDPWTAPTAWSAWALSELGERRAAGHLLAALRRSRTPAGALPERLGRSSGLPRSTTPLAWSHAFAVLALRSRWAG